MKIKHTLSLVTLLLIANYSISAQYFWIGDSGNWSVASNWSDNTGGLAGTTVPTSLDSVYFDGNSFTSPNPMITVDVDSEFGMMDWTGTTETPTLQLDAILNCFGDVTLIPNLTIVSNGPGFWIEFKQTSAFNSNSSFLNCNFSNKMNTVGDSVLLTADINMADTSTVYLINGGFYSNDFDIHSGAFQTVILDTLNDIRTLDFGNSIVDLEIGLNALNEAGNFFFNGGNSNLTIGHPDYINFLQTAGMTFYDVTLDFPALNSAQIVEGDNDFNKLIINAGSTIQFQSGFTQSINDSLVMDATCRDSIYLYTEAVGSTAFFDKTNAATVSSFCVDIKDIEASNAIITTFFSTSNGNATNWDLDPTPPVSSVFSVDGPFCFGDTTQLTNTSFGYSGNPNDVTSVWFFNDGSTGYYTYSGTDSTWISYESDTTQHQFLVSGDIDVSVVSTFTNGCIDTTTQSIYINNPSVFLSSSEFDKEICAGEEVIFETSSPMTGVEFEFYYNNVQQNTASVNDTLYITSALQDGDSVSVLAYENSCVSDTMPSIKFTVNPLPTVTWTNDDADTTICENITVSFSGAGANQYQYLKNGLDVTGTISSGNYTPNDLVNGDEIELIGIETTNSCRDTVGPMIFTVYPEPIPVLSSSITGNIICENESVTFTATGGDSYEFLIDGLSQGVTTNPNFTTTSIQAGDTVTLLAHTNNGCQKTASESFTYIVNPLPNVTLASSIPSQTICSGDNVTFNSTGANSYTFYVENTIVQGPSSLASYTTSGLNDNDEVYVIGSFSGCSNQSTSEFYTVNQSPTTTLATNVGSTTICQETEVIFTANGANTYGFYIDGAIQGSVSATNTLSVDDLVNGQTVTVIGNSNGCELTQALTFTVLSLPSVNLFSDVIGNTICQGETITITGVNADSYQLIVNDVAQGLEQTSPTFVPTLNNGANSVYIIGTGSNGCKDTSSSILTVTQNVIPSVVLTSSGSTICAEDLVTINGSGSDLYQFYLDGNPLGSTSSVDSYSLNSLADGQTISLSGSTLGCTGQATPITFTVNSIPIINLTSTDSDNVFCENEDVTISSFGATNYTIELDGNLVSPSSNQNTYDASSLGDGTYQLNFIGETSGCSSSLQTSLTINPLPVAQLTSSETDNTICENESVTYTGENGNLYEFLIDGVSQGAPGILDNFTSTNFQNGEVVGVIVATSFGCLDTTYSQPIVVNTTPTTAINSSVPSFIICENENVDITFSGATDYTLYLNGNVDGTFSNGDTYSTTLLSDDDEIYVVGETNGCENQSAILTFTVNNYPILAITNNSDTSICEAELTDLITSGANTYQYYVNGNPIGGSNTTGVFNSALTNNDIVTVEGTLNGCTILATEQITYLVNAIPNASAISSPTNTTICQDELVDFTGSGAQGYIFEWNGILVQNGINNVFSTDELENGDLISVTGYNGDCSATPIDFVFTVNSMNLDISASESTVICENESVTFTASGGNLYEFFVNGNSVTGLTTSPTYTTTTLTDNDQVTISAQSTSTNCVQQMNGYFTMNVLDAPVISPNGNTTFCEGDSVVLVSNSSAGNEWFLNGNPIEADTDTSIIARQSGTYSLNTILGGSGQFWSIGNNASGNFGDSTNIDSIDPVENAMDLVFTEISSGDRFLLGITDAGEVYGWGNNEFGMLGDGTYNSNNYPVIVPSLVGIKTVSTSSTSSMATTYTGDVYCWGNNDEGQLGIGSNAVINFPYQNPNVTGVDTISAGYNHFVFLKNDGTVWATGNNDYGQLGQNDLMGSVDIVQVGGLSDIVSIGTGFYNSFAIDNNGVVYAWGDNSSGQLGLGDLNNRLIPTTVNLTDIENIQGGASHTLYLTNENTVLASGNNDFGQLGSGNNTASSSPIKVDIALVSSISAGENNSLFLKNDYSVFGSGKNEENQLSPTATNSYNAPTHLSHIDGVTQIESSSMSSHFIYGESAICSANDVIVNMLAMPEATISLNGTTFSTLSGGSQYQWYLNGNEVVLGTQSTYDALVPGYYSVEITYANGCVSLSEELPYGIVGLEEKELIVNLFPNPTNANLNLTTSHLLENLLVYDQSGRSIQLSILDVNGQIQIETSVLKSGVYYIEYEFKALKYRKKFVKVD